MRIIGGKDYYDSALAYGRDEALVFARRRHSVADGVPAASVPLSWPRKLALKGGGERYDWGHTVQIGESDNRVLVSTIYVWFAGKRYGGVFAANPTRYLEKPRWFWSHAAFLEFLNEMRSTVAQPHKWRDDVIDASTIEAHFENRGTATEQEWAISNGVAIAIPSTASRTDDQWFFNTDGLKDIDFAKAVDPFAAFQELSMYVGGVMARPEKPIVEITDSKIVASKHGFDNWSFRKMGQPR